ncbi:hypothetical protein NF716_10770 [Lactococcus formosensis]|uniref:Uncharacterized protein n=1 Tax=Lactococcus petauri TaxID=1940789 RepID=A0AAJ2J0Z6_9LACT|nr:MULTISPECIES: hypothetical protein [Lactococcus]MDG6156809.1 hypothetical protein [Lactococcus formosensis]MDT2528034.1 hypothetical protein [Lactococcus petauri]MDT2561296.1 hypothetical protein [Lactococcus petauri]MDT2586651.1 hypothetical protein [Lactococcus petauri]MDT2667586.1 hypothetical protein [Lactococcus petauri]
MRRIAYLVGFKYVKTKEFEARGFSTKKKARNYIKRKEKAWGIEFEDWEIKKVILTDYSRYEEYMEVWEGLTLTVKYIMIFLIFLASYVFSATLLPTHLTLFLFSIGVTWMLMQGIHLASRLIFFVIDIFDFIKYQTNKELDLEVFEIQERSLLFKLDEWKTIKIEGELLE